MGDASIAAPALTIETVAAGGGSICHLDGRQLKVGPESAGAFPGPACYGAGGPLTLTDVNLLLGRLDAERFGIPVSMARAEDALGETLSTLGNLGSKIKRHELLLGYFDIANQRMADAIRRISVRQGYDPTGHALVAFGGAGGQHACAVAARLGMSTVVMPRQAGLLSALGLGAAVFERFASRQVLSPLEAVVDQIDGWLGELEAEAGRELVAEGIKLSAVEVRRRSIFLRLRGQESALEVDARAGDDWAASWLQLYRGRYGYAPSAPELEVESLRVVASTRSTVRPSRPAESAASKLDGRAGAEPESKTSALLGGRWQQVPVYSMATLAVGQSIRGPSLVFDAHSALTLDRGWSARVNGAGHLVARADSMPESASPEGGGR